MSDIVERMVDCVNSAETEIKAEYSYKSDFLKRAVTETAAYFGVKRLGAFETEISILVYSPVFKNGKGCTEAAKEVCGILRNGGFEIYNLTVGAVSYNGSSQGFVTEISGVVFDDGEELSIGGVSVSAYNFSTDKNLSAEFFAEGCDYSVSGVSYPIMTVFENKPFDVISENKIAKIVLRGIAEKYSKLLSGGTFDLKLSDSEKVFVKCFCDSIYSSGVGKVNVDLRGYDE